MVKIKENILDNKPKLSSYTLYYIYVAVYKAGRYLFKMK